MKGKNYLTKSECASLMRLIKRKVNSNKSEQKKIRDEMRDMGFYVDDFYGAYKDGANTTVNRSPRW